MAHHHQGLSQVAEEDKRQLSELKPAARERASFKIAGKGVDHLTIDVVRQNEAEAIEEVQLAEQYMIMVVGVVASKSTRTKKSKSAQYGPVYSCSRYLR